MELVHALRYEPEGRGLNSQWGHWSFSLAFTLPAAGVDSGSDRKVFQGSSLGGGGKGGRCVVLTTVPPSCVDCLDILDPLGPVQAFVKVNYKYESKG
jgi:hypothetical protein